MPGTRGLRIGLLFAGLVAVTACDTQKMAADATAELFGRAAPGIEQHWDYDVVGKSFPASIIQLEGLLHVVPDLSLIHISEPTRPRLVSRMPSSA